MQASMSSNYPVLDPARRGKREVTAWGAKATLDKVIPSLMSANPRARRGLMIPSTPPAHPWPVSSDSYIHVMLFVFRDELSDDQPESEHFLIDVVIAAMRRHLSAKITRLRNGTINNT